MKAALIPPKGYETTAGQSDYHLVLAQELKRESYLSTYKMLGADFIILDNGAAEGEQVSNLDLLDAALALKANEIVMPDVICNSEGTLTAIDEFIYDLNESDDDFSHLQLMAVVQGETIEECYDFIRKVEKSGVAGTLGIPRHLINTLADPSARCRLATFIEGTFGIGRFDVHFLGTNSSWIGEVHVLGRDFPWARGVDSSAPFNYTIAGEDLGVPEPERAHIDRPNAYFTSTRTLDTELLQKNINTYTMWANGLEA